MKAAPESRTPAAVVGAMENYDLVKPSAAAVDYLFENLGFMHMAADTFDAVVNGAAESEPSAAWTDDNGAPSELGLSVVSPTSGYAGGVG